MSRFAGLFCYGTGSCSLTAGIFLILKQNKTKNNLIFHSKGSIFARSDK